VSDTINGVYKHQLCISVTAVLWQICVSRHAPQEKKVATLQHDETDERGRKLQAYQLTSSKEALALGVFHVANKTAAKSVSKLAWYLESVCQPYGERLLGTVLKDRPNPLTLLCNIYNSISDRASTEQLFNKLLEDKINEELGDLGIEERRSLHKLYCWMHLLAGWSDEMNKKFQKHRMSFNQEGNAFSLLYSTVKLFRFGSDYEQSLASIFLLVCEDEDAKKHVKNLERIVGSRSTTTVKDALTSLLADSALLAFLNDKECCAKDNLLVQAVSNGLKNPELTSQRIVLALMNDYLFYPTFKYLKVESKDIAAAALAPLAQAVDVLLSQIILTPKEFIQGHVKLAAPFHREPHDRVPISSHPAVAQRFVDLEDLVLKDVWSLLKQCRRCTDAEQRISYEVRIHACAHASVCHSGQYMCILLCTR
jgi:hypothetical protein